MHHLKKNLLRLSAFLIFTTVHFCVAWKTFHRKKTSLNLEQPLFQPDPTKPITIIIHGTRLPPLLLATVPLLHQQVCTPKGLHKAKDVGYLYKAARSAKALSQADPVNFPYENIYLFGWGGTLSFAERKKAAGSLHTQLKLLRKNPAYTHTSITLITVSHGGNVALEIGNKAAQLNDNEPLIERLILLCCPVQQATANSIYMPTFKHIFHLYACRDIIQVLDPQGLYSDKEMGCQPNNLFSQRVFKNPPSHLIQAEICRGNRTLYHIDFAFSAFFKCIPSCLEKLCDPITQQALPRNIHDHCIINIARARHRHAAKHSQ